MQITLMLLHHIVGEDVEKAPSVTPILHILVLHGFAAKLGWYHKKKKKNINTVFRLTPILGPERLVLGGTTPPLHYRLKGTSLEF